MKSPPIKIFNLIDLKIIKSEIIRNATEVAQDAAIKAEKLELMNLDKNLFINAARSVKPLQKQVARIPKVLPKKIKTIQHKCDEKIVFQDPVSDDFDVSSLLDTDDILGFRRPGIDIDVTKKLRVGNWAIQRQLDLHGLRTDQARETVSDFIRDSYRQGIRCIRIIHGKGLGSPGKTPILKTKVHSWLVQTKEVLAFVQAKPADGGAGALIVLLMTARSVN